MVQPMFCMKKENTADHSERSYAPDEGNDENNCLLIIMNSIRKRDVRTAIKRKTFLGKKN